MFIHYTPNDVTRFWSKVIKLDDPDACWLCTTTPSQIYGHFQINDKAVKMHRMAYFLTYGEYPDDLFVCHSCDTPRCCNPKHLFLGTYLDNIEDCIAKKRHTRGIKQGLHKLDNNKVQEIRRLYAEGGISQRELGERFGVNQTVISSAILHKTWKG